MLGDYLIVVVARDENVEKVKGKLSYNNEEKRVKEIKSLLNFKRLFVKNFHLQNKYIVDEVLLGNKNDKYLIVEDNGVGMDKKSIEGLLTDNTIKSHSTGIGISNVKKRLELFYDSNDIMFIESEIGIGTKVFIKLLEN